MRFSVVIPAYGAGRTLAAAIESALAQSEPPHEVVVVDDASPDDQEAVATRYAGAVRYVRRETNGGDAAAKDTGASIASSEFVVTLDADDTWHPRRLERLAELLEARPELDIATTDAMIVEGGRPVRRYYGGVTGATWEATSQRQAILERNFIFSHAAVRRGRWIEVGGQHTVRRDLAADWAFWVKLILSGSRAGLVNEPLANYAITAASVSDSATRLARTREIAMALALEMPTLSPEEQGVARENLEDARRQLFRLESRSALWRSERCRSRFVRIAVSSRYRKRHRAEALLATLFPSAARSQMKGDPDLVERA